MGSKSLIWVIKINQEKKNQLGVFSTTLDKKKIKERKFRYKNQNRKDA